MLKRFFSFSLLLITPLFSLYGAQAGEIRSIYNNSIKILEAIDKAQEKIQKDLEAGIAACAKNAVNGYEEYSNILQEKYKEALQCNVPCLLFAKTVYWKDEWVKLRQISTYFDKYQQTIVDRLKNYSINKNGINIVNYNSAGFLDTFLLIINICTKWEEYNMSPARLCLDCIDSSYYYYEVNKRWQLKNNQTTNLEAFITLQAFKDHVKDNNAYYIKNEISSADKKYYEEKIALEAYEKAQLNAYQIKQFKECFQKAFPLIELHINLFQSTRDWFNYRSHITVDILCNNEGEVQPFQEEYRILCGHLLSKNNNMINCNLVLAEKKISLIKWKTSQGVTPTKSTSSNRYVYYTKNQYNQESNHFSPKRKQPMLNCAQCGNRRSSKKCACGFNYDKNRYNPNIDSYRPAYYKRERIKTVT